MDIKNEHNNLLCVDIYRNLRSSMRIHLLSAIATIAMRHPSIDPKRWYTAIGAAPLLMVTQETVKAYCRQGTLKAKQVGPKKAWHVLGESILKLREHWRIDD